MGQSAPQCGASHTCWSLGWLCVSVLVSTPSQPTTAHGHTAFLLLGCRWASSLVFPVCVLVFLCVSFMCHRHLLYLGWARISLHLFSR